MLCIAHCLSMDGNSAREKAFHSEKQLGSADFTTSLACAIMAQGCHFTTVIKMRKFLALHRLAAHGSLG